MLVDFNGFHVGEYTRQSWILCDVRLVHFKEERNSWNLSGMVMNKLGWNIYSKDSTWYVPILGYRFEICCRSIWNWHPNRFSSILMNYELHSHQELYGFESFLGSWCSQLGSRKWWHHLGQWKAVYVKKQPGLLDVGKQQLDDFGRLQTVVLKLSSWLSFICWFYKCRWLAHGWDCRKLHALYITMLFPTWLSGITRCFSPRRGARLLAPASFITLLLVLLLAAAIRCYYHNHPLLFWPCFVLFFIFGDISKQRNVSLRFWDQQTFHVFRAKT